MLPSSCRADQRLAGPANSSALDSGELAYPARVPSGLSPRLAAIVAALPVEPHMRVLEIGCGTGAAARAVAARLEDGHILATDRSAKAVALTEASSEQEITSGRMSVRHVAVEDFELAPEEAPYDLVFAVRVGALDGRHPELEARARERIRTSMAPGGRLFVDGHESPVSPVRDQP